MFTISDPPIVSNIVLQERETCYDQITLNWNSTDSDYYRITVFPLPTTGICSTGECVVQNSSTVVNGLVHNVEYEFRVNGINCGGIGHSTMLRNTIIAQGKCNIIEL